MLPETSLLLHIQRRMNKAEDSESFASPCLPFECFSIATKNIANFSTKCTLLIVKQGILVWNAPLQVKPSNEENPETVLDTRKMENFGGSIDEPPRNLLTDFLLARAPIFRELAELRARVRRDPSSRVSLRTVIFLGTEINMGWNRAGPTKMGTSISSSSASAQTMQTTPVGEISST